MRIPSQKNIISESGFRAAFLREETCREYVAGIRWSGKIVCPHCKANKVYRYRDGKLYKCSKCRKQFSVFSGTLFENSKIPLKKWFMAIHLIITDKNGTSSMQLSRKLKMTQKTAWLLLNRIGKTLQLPPQINEKTGRKIPRVPMMSKSDMSFDEVLNQLIQPIGKPAVNRIGKKKTKPVIQPSALNPNRPSQEFDPETD
jgi:transposase-like protein